MTLAGQHPLTYSFVVSPGETTVLDLVVPDLSIHTAVNVTHSYRTSNHSHSHSSQYTLEHYESMQNSEAYEYSDTWDSQAEYLDPDPEKSPTSVPVKSAENGNDWGGEYEYEDGNTWPVEDGEYSDNDKPLTSPPKSVQANSNPAIEGHLEHNVPILSHNVPSGQIAQHNIPQTHNSHNAPMPNHNFHNAPIQNPDILVQELPVQDSPNWVVEEESSVEGVFSHRTDHNKPVHVANEEDGYGREYESPHAIAVEYVKYSYQFRHGVEEIRQ